MARVQSEHRLLPSSTLRTSKWKSNAFQSRRKVEVFVRCTDLVQLDTFSKSDPMCVLSVKKLGHWAEYGRTESIPNTLQPKFVESFVIEANTSQHPYVRFSVYDMANFTSKDLRKHDFIGSVEIEFEVMLSTPPPVVRTLRIPGDVKTRGWITIHIEEVLDSRTNVRLHLGASKLEKKGLFGKCDAFFELNRLLNEGEFHPVYRSEVVTKTVDPKWTPLEIPLQKLCNSDVERQVQLICWHFSNNGVHSCIGEATFTVSQLMKKNIRTLDVINTNKRTRSKRYTNSGLVRMLHSHVDTHYSLLDYVRGGCAVRLAFAIDFTMSNGDPSLADSLHSATENKNEYIQAIECLGAVMAQYDPASRIPVYGFGAKAISSWPYCFPLDGDEQNVEVQSIDNVVQLYLETLEKIQLGGPTRLAPVIQRIAHYTQSSQLNCSQQYVVMVIITDGVINDIDETVEQLIKAANLPISFVILGVGPADFMLMEEICNSTRGPLRLSKGKSLQRQNTYFAAVRKHNDGSGLDQAMAREAFAHVSRQIVSYMKSRGIEPSPPQATSIKPWKAWDDIPDNTVGSAMLQSQRPSSPRMRKRTSEPTPRCPTCGSVIEGNNNIVM